MGRAPCCEKMGLKKGPWTAEEDQILINFINLYGHGNWRALPKLAGLLRCGKSCRLRWTNYLRPDIKRGNFSREEEDTIIQLHQSLGNRWSTIAAKLQGRTDNEIKNVWHTHLKKRLTQKTFTTQQQEENVISSLTPDFHQNNPVSPPQPSSSNSDNTRGGSPENVHEMDNFWSEVMSDESFSNNTSEGYYDQYLTELPFNIEPADVQYNGMEFWFDLYKSSRDAFM